MNNKQGVPATKVPIIGNKDRKIVDETVQTMFKYLDPIMNNVTDTIARLDQRLTILEEVKKIFTEVGRLDELEKRVSKLERPGK